MRFNQVKITLAVATLLWLPSSASADSIADAASDDVYDATLLETHEGRGYLLADGLLFHSAFGIGGGFNDNVFFESSNENPVSAGSMNLGLRLALTSDRVTTADLGDPDSTDAELSPRNYEFNGGARLGYTEYITDNDAVRKQRRLNGNANLDLVANPGGTVSFLLRDRFFRDMRSPNLEDNETINRDDNRLMAGVRFRPSGQRSSATVRYENWLSAFEEGGPFVSRMNHTLGGQAEAVFGNMTKTRLLGDVSVGFFGPLGDGSSMIGGEPFKSRSIPFRATVGVVHEVTSQATVKVHGGYSRSDYKEGPDYSAPNFGAEVATQWATGRVSAIYDFDHFDSINANFYRDHLFALKLVQKIEYLWLDGGPEIRRRHFEGIPMSLGPSERDDTVIAVRARAQLVLADRFALSAEYRLGRVKTDYRENDGSSPSFMRNELMFAVWAAY